MPLIQQSLLCFLDYFSDQPNEEQRISGKISFYQVILKKQIIIRWFLINNIYLIEDEKLPNLINNYGKLRRLQIIISEMLKN